MGLAPSYQPSNPPPATSVPTFQHAPQSGLDLLVWFPRAYAALLLGDRRLGRDFSRRGPICENQVRAVIAPFPPSFPTMLRRRSVVPTSCHQPSPCKLGVSPTRVGDRGGVGRGTADTRTRPPGISRRKGGVGVAVSGWGSGERSAGARTNLGRTSERPSHARADPRCSERKRAGCTPSGGGRLGGATEVPLAPARAHLGSKEAEGRRRGRADKSPLARGRSRNSNPGLPGVDRGA